MDRNSKIGFGLLGAASACMAVFFNVRLKQLEKLLEVVDKTQDNMLRIMDMEYQKQIDERFEDIADNYDE